jgi:hypothetical protein
MDAAVLETVEVPGTDARYRLFMISLHAESVSLTGSEGTESARNFQGEGRKAARNIDVRKAAREGEGRQKVREGEGREGAKGRGVTEEAREGRRRENASEGVGRESAREGKRREESGEGKGREAARGRKREMEREGMKRERDTGQGERT